MLAELLEDNKALASRLREAHGVCEEHNDIATASLLKSGSTKPNGVPGFSSKRRDAPILPGIETFSCVGD